MNIAKTYRAWITGRKAQTLETLQADSSFAARMRIANKYGVKTLEVVAIRTEVAS
jgi:hypothetical protein